MFQSSRSLTLNAYAFRQTPETLSSHVSVSSGVLSAKNWAIHTLRCAESEYTSATLGGAPHRCEFPTALAANRRSTDGEAASGNGVLRKATAEDDFKRDLPSAIYESSAQAAEGALIDRILSGHKELFMELIRPHQRTVYATVFPLLANKQDAEDVAQDAFLKALARLHQFRKESSFGT